MGRIVLKFGGSSVSSIDKMRHIAIRIIERKEIFNEIVVVVSAMGNTTNQLLSLAKEAVKHPSKREMDMLLSTGEIISTALLSMILQEMGYPAISLSGLQAGIKTKGLHTKNKIEDIHTGVIEKNLKEGKIVVIAGFQGFNADGDVTTLGRGGSDTSAVALAAKLGCNCEIYTDVSGIYGVDPRLYPAAKKLTNIRYEEMEEMAYLGAKVMEPRSIDIAQRFGVEIYVASAHTQEVGTYIKESSEHMEETAITGLTISEKVMMVSLKRFPHHAALIAKLFIELANNEVNVDVINQTPSINGHIHLAFTASADDLDAINEVLEPITNSYKETIVTKSMDVIKLSVVGSKMRTQSGVAAHIFALFAENNIEFKLVTTSEISISYTMDRKYMKQAVNILSQAFDL